MLHSKITYKNYYQFSGVSDTIITHAEIKDLANKKHFTDAMDKYILFEWPLNKYRSMYVN